MTPVRGTGAEGGNGDVVGHRVKVSRTRRPPADTGRTCPAEALDFRLVAREISGPNGKGGIDEVVPDGTSDAAGGAEGRRRVAGGGSVAAFCSGCRRTPADRYLAGRRGRLFGIHRHRRAAHRHLCGAGRGRAQGLQARHRAHQQRPSADQEDLAQDHQGRAGQGGQVRRRRFRRQAQQRRAGAAALHQREQGGLDDRLDLERGGGRAEQARAAREGALRRRHLRLERHHRQGLRPLRLPAVLLWPDRRRRASARCCSRRSARTGRRRS